MTNFLSLIPNFFISFTKLLSHFSFNFPLPSTKLDDPILRTIIYTIGHICIAVTCLMLIASVPFSVAMTDAIVEPLLNGVWYYVLDRYWASRVTASKITV